VKIALLKATMTSEAIATSAIMDMWNFMLTHEELGNVVKVGPMHILEAAIKDAEKTGKIKE
jgi:hypothetical protein